MKTLLKLFFFIFLLTFSVSKSFAEFKKVYFSGKNYNISIPRGFCDISNTVIGKFLFQHIEESQKNTNLKATKLKLIIAHCNYNENNIYPWGYIGLLKKTKNFSQKTYNDVVSKLFDDKNLMNDLSELTSKAVNKTMNKYFSEKKNGVNTLQTPEVLYKDEYSIIYRAMNTGMFEGEIVNEVVVSSSSVLTDVIINTYLNNELNEEPNSFSLAGVLIENSKLNFESNY